MGIACYSKKKNVRTPISVAVGDRSYLPKFFPLVYEQGDAQFSLFVIVVLWKYCIYHHSFHIDYRG